MAIRLANLYPSQVATDANYPYGKPRNEGTPNVSRDGTPFEAAWLADIWGFFQGLLVTADITPSDTPDSATTSQYREALQWISRHMFGDSSVTGAFLVSGPTEFQSDVSVSSGGLHVAAGLAQFDAGLAASGGADLDGTTQLETLTVSGTATVAGDLTVESPAPGGLVVHGNSELANVSAESVAVTSLLVSADAFLTDARFSTVIGPNAATALQRGKIYVVTTLTADRAYTLPAASVTGAWVLVTCTHDTYKVIVGMTADGTYDVGAGGYKSLLFVAVGGVWRVGLFGPTN